MGNDRWKKAHEIVEQIRSKNLSKDALERILGVMIEMLGDGGTDYTKVESAGKLILMFRSPNGIEGYLDQMQKLSLELERTGI